MGKLLQERAVHRQIKNPWQKQCNVGYITTMRHQNQLDIQVNWLQFAQYSVNFKSHFPESERSKCPWVNLTRVLKWVETVYKTNKRHKIHSSHCKHLQVLKPTKSNINFPTTNINSSKKNMLKMVVMLWPSPTHNLYEKYPTALSSNNSNSTDANNQPVGLYYHILNQQILPIKNQSRRD